METNARIALITGATRGLGREVALRLASQNHTVWVGARNEAAAEPVVLEISRGGGKALALALDVSDQASIARAVARVLQHSERLTSSSTMQAS